MTDTPTYTAPEIQEAERRLNALPTAWVSDELRAAAITAAQQAAFAAEAAQSLAVGRDLVAAATHNRDWPSLVRATAQVLAAVQASSSLPSLSPAHVDGAADVAAAELGAAVSGIPAVPALSVDLELAAWRSWQFRAHQNARGPVELPAEHVLSDRLAAWRQQAALIAGTVAHQSGAEFAGDTLDQLERCWSLLPSVRQVAESGAVLAEQVTAANAQREQAGLSWDCTPPDIAYSAGTTSPELRALARHRAQRREAVPA